MTAERPPDLPERLLLGPGPSNVSESVRQAMARPLIGHLDPAFLAVLDEIQEQLARLFRTRDARVIPISATGSAGMECLLVNLLEPGDRALIAVQGVFGQRMCDIVGRIGATAIPIEAPMGECVPTEDFTAAVERERPALVAWVHAETSTGVAAPVQPIAEAARRVGALALVDCVTSLAGMPFEFDEWGVDAAYSGTQKCLGVPPGLSPIAVGPRALERLAQRRTPVQSWYLDLNLIGRYFGGERVYHHTAPISALFGLRAGLQRIFDEGLEARFARHRAAHEALVAGLERLGFRMWVEPDLRLPMLNTVVPPYEDEAAARRRLLERAGIEVGGGLGKLAGRVWRIGLMGENARVEVVERLLDALS